MTIFQNLASCKNYGAHTSSYLELETKVEIVMIFNSLKARKQLCMRAMRDVINNERNEGQAKYSRRLDMIKYEIHCLDETMKVFQMQFNYLKLNLHKNDKQ